MVLHLPLHPDANHNLGVIAVQLGQPEHALPLLNTALTRDLTQGDSGSATLMHCCARAILMRRISGWRKAAKRPGRTASG